MVPHICRQFLHRSPRSANLKSQRLPVSKTPSLKDSRSQRLPHETPKCQRSHLSGTPVHRVASGPREKRAGTCAAEWPDSQVEVGHGGTGGPLCVGITTGIEGHLKTPTQPKRIAFACIFAGGSEGMPPKKFFESVHSLTHSSQKTSENAPILTGFTQNGAISSKIKRFS